MPSAAKPAGTVRTRASAVPQESSWSPGRAVFGSHRRGLVIVTGGGQYGARQTRHTKVIRDPAESRAQVTNGGKRLAEIGLLIVSLWSVFAPTHSN